MRFVQIYILCVTEQQENNYLQRLPRHTLFGNTFRSTGSKKDTQKYITKKVQAYFKHLCALKLKFEAKMV